MADFSLQWGQFGAAVASVGSLGVASFGIVESAGKAFAFAGTDPRSKKHTHFGLPYVGLGAVKAMMEPLGPALACAYGEGYLDVIAEQYRSNRGDGSAPDTVRQGVRLGIPYLGTAVASKIIASVWQMDQAHADALAAALQAPDLYPAADTSGTGDKGAPATTTSISPSAALAGRFAAALDARISAAFQLAEEQYESAAKTIAGFVAVALALLFNWGLASHATGDIFAGVFPWPLALGIGVVAVPLAPVAKDLSTSLQNALTAFQSIAGKSS